MRLRSAKLLVAGIFAVLILFLPIFVTPVHAEEPILEEILNNLGFTNITESTAETFPAGLYEVTLYAEFAGYHSTNEISYYPVNTSDFTLIFSGPEGNSGYTTPPINKTFPCNATFGLSMYVAQEDHRYYTEHFKNPDGENHSRIYLNLDEPDMYFIGFENLYGLGDRDYNDMVLSLKPVKHYLTVETDPSGIISIPGEDWYNHCTNVTLTAPDTVSVSSGVQYNFDYWDVDSITAPGNPIVVHMDDNHTITAHYILQYYLTVTTDPTGVNTPSGEGWYDAGSYASISTDELIDIVPGSSRYNFSDWTTANMSEITDPSSPSTNVLMDQPKTVTANYETQYYLTVETDPLGIAKIPGGGWYDESTNVPLTAPSVVDYKFLHWEVDGVPQDAGDESISVSMNMSHTAIACYEEIIIGGSTVSVKSPLLPTWISLNVMLIAVVFITSSWVRKRRMRTK